MTSVKESLYHRQMLKGHHWDMDNTTDKFCVPLIPQTGTHVAQFSVMIDTLLCPETPSIMIMFGFRIFNPERNLWIDMAMNEHGHVYRDDFRMEDNVLLGGGIVAGTLLKFAVTWHNEGNIVCAINNGRNQPMGGCCLLQSFVLSESNKPHELIFLHLYMGMLMEKEIVRIADVLFTWYKSLHY